MLKYTKGLEFRGMSPSARRIIELNIEHYRETDAVKRRTVAQHLTEEEAKLANKLIDAPKESDG
jgi:hypothetical protein